MLQIATQQFPRTKAERTGPGIHGNIRCGLIPAGRHTAVITERGGRYTGRPVPFICTFSFAAATPSRTLTKTKINAEI